MTQRVRRAGGSGLKTDDQPWKYVEVDWIDAVSENAWTAAGECPCVANIKTRGWLVKKDKNSITIAGTITILDDGEEEDEDKIDVGEIITIPRGCINGIYELVARKGKKVRL